MVKFINFSSVSQLRYFLSKSYFVYVKEYIFVIILQQDVSRSSVGTIYFSNCAESLSLKCFELVILVRLLRKTRRSRTWK